MNKILKKVLVAVLAAVIGFGTVAAATPVETKAATKAEVQYLLYKAEAAYQGYVLKLQKYNTAIQYNKKEMAEVTQKIAVAKKYGATKLVKQYTARLKLLKKKETLLYKEVGVCQGKMKDLKEKIAVYQAWLKAH